MQLSCGRQAMADEDEEEKEITNLAKLQREEWDRGKQGLPAAAINNISLLLLLYNNNNSNVLTFSASAQPSIWPQSPKKLFGM